MNEKRKQVSPSFKNSTVYHEASTFGTATLKSKNYNRLSSCKSETQAVQD